ncbi:hypothetical protein BRADI_2g58415v3 [Brachypodium distachyon]|uniref:MADS-box domain-containing protein n=1 Tax=Brachypodium distachyon TaxID=15368 RepID=A0A0Q3GL31_BRADI|nr:hypothetical protein BRADI_2g58415v3 [Brachypodium distachyon]
MASPVTDLQKRRQSFAARKVGVIEKAQEMGAKTNAPTAVVVSGGGGQLGPDVGYWPSKEAATAAAKQVRALPDQARTKSTHGHTSHLAALRDARRAHRAAAQEGGGGGISGSRALERMPGAAILKLRSRVGASREATDGKIWALQQPQNDEGVAENFVAGDAWMRQLLEDLKEKPWRADAPYNAEIEYINVCGFVMERDAYDFIRFDLGMPLPDLYPESTDYDADMRL